ncbi:Uncharacterised protein [Salmonella enterica subsp. enterica]|nr:Uncharacterised protein [Salmonella enterica subsp. enterica]
MTMTFFFGEERGERMKRAANRPVALTLTGPMMERLPIMREQDRSADGRSRPVRNLRQSPPRSASWCCSPYSRRKRLWFYSSRKHLPDRQRQPVLYYSPAPPAASYRSGHKNSCAGCSLVNFRPLVAVSATGVKNFSLKKRVTPSAFTPCSTKSI